MNNARLIPGLILILLGLAFLTGWNIFAYLWPLLLIFIGIRIIFGGQNHDNQAEFNRVDETKENQLNETVIFGGIKKKVITDDFKGGRIVCIFGGGQIDLREVKAEKNINMELVTIFGGLELLVPKNWIVKSSGVGIVGGFNNQAYTDGSGPEINISGAAIFGGVDVKN